MLFSFLYYGGFSLLRWPGCCMLFSTTVAWMLNAFLYYGGLDAECFSLLRCPASILIVLSLCSHIHLGRTLNLPSAYTPESSFIRICYSYVQLAHAYLICYFWGCVCAMIVFVFIFIFIFIFMRIWARAIYILRKNKAPFSPAKNTETIGVGARGSFFSTGSV
jgi:hypothetical protein